MYKKYLTWNFHVLTHGNTCNSKLAFLPLTRLHVFCLLALILLSGNYLSAQSLSEKTYSVTFTNSSFEQAVKQLESQSKIKFVYNETLISKRNRINRSFKNQTLPEILTVILYDYDVSYEMIDNKYIILKSSEPKRVKENSTGAGQKVNQTGFVQTGLILDEIGKPLPGVSIRLNNASNVATTDVKGRYQIGIPRDETLLIFSYVGYKNVERKATRNQELDLNMEPDPGRLDEVNVIGYGTSSKRTSTGSSGGITGYDLEKTPAANPASALQGRVAGVYITQQNGLPGSPMTFTIRGTNSLTGRNNPLFIVDGVPYLAEAINALAGNQLDAANGSTSPLNSLNPSDIESINVLKDADATAIYGSRGANGVVLITTKKGKAGKTQVEGMVKQGFSEVSHFVNLLSTPQYLAIRRRGYENTGIDPLTDDAYDLTRWDQNAQTDFQKLLIGNTAKMTDANVALSGGDERTNFRASGTYLNQGNVFTRAQGYRRTSFNLNVGHRSLDQKFEVTISAIYSAEKNNVSVLDQTSAAYNLPPNYPLYNADGSLYWSGVSFGVPTNPLGQLNQVQNNLSSTLVSNMTMSYNILQGLNFKTSMGFSRSDMEQSRLYPMSSMDPGVSWNESRSIFANNNSTNYIIEPQLNYTKKISRGNLTTLLGGTWQSQNSKQPYYTLAYGFPSDAFLEDRM